MNYREDQRLRAIAAEAGRTDLVEAMDCADAELDAAAAQTSQAYARYVELNREQDRLAEVVKEIRRQIRGLAAEVKS